MLRRLVSIRPRRTLGLLDQRLLSMTQRTRFARAGLFRSHTQREAFGHYVAQVGLSLRSGCCAKTICQELLSFTDEVDFYLGGLLRLPIIS